VGRNVCVCGEKSDKMLCFSNPDIIKGILREPHAILYVLMLLGSRRKNSPDMYSWMNKKRTKVLEGKRPMRKWKNNIRKETYGTDINVRGSEVANYFSVTGI
jgi:hypothetical protein